MIFLYASKFAKPNDGAQIDEDGEGSLEDLFNNPAVVGEEDDAPGGKTYAYVLCGARYFETAESRDKENIECVECLVLDVDSNETPDGTVPSEAVLRENLAGVRSIVYTSPSHTAQLPRWRVLLPLLSPLPPKKHRALVAWLSANLVAGFPGCINVDATGDPGRLGFFGVTKHPDDYRWWSQKGKRFDWTVIPLEDERWANAAPLGELKRSPLWTDTQTALKAALKRYASTGQGVRRGEGRTMILWDAALALWWSWAAEDSDFVMTVLRHINTNFVDPEEEDELLRKCTEAEQRAIGERRKGQNAGTYGWAREPSNFITPQTILSYAKRLRQRRNLEDVLVGDTLKTLVKGEAFNEDQTAWRGLLNKCAHALARGFPSESAERIASFFRGSLSTMRAAGAVLPSEEEIRNIIETRLEGARRQRQESAERNDAKQRDDIEFATRGERTEKYTKQEIETWKQAGVGLHDRNWLIVSGRAVFVFRNGTWVGPYTREEFEAQGYLDLTAACDFVRTKVYNEEKQTWTAVPLTKLLNDYGSSCTTRVDLACEKTWFNEEDGELILAGPKKRDLTPRFHEEVDQWLRIATHRNRAVPHTIIRGIVKGVEEILSVGEWTKPSNMKVRQLEAGGAQRKDDDYDVLCDWLACLVQLDHPCAALYLEGKTSTGKGLFASAIARVWKTGAIPLEKAFERFNNLLLESALIWVDEGLPENVKASVLLRKALSAEEFVYERKNKDSGKVAGCLRMIFTANNLNLFNKTKELVKKNDIDALEKRFVHIHINPEAAAYLREINPRHRAFVQANQLAEHLLWLTEKRWPSIKAKGERFLVVGKNTSVSDVVATNSEVTSDVCQIVCDALTGANTGFGGGFGMGSSGLKTPPWLLVRDGNVLVHASSLKDALNSRVGRNIYNDRDVTRAITSIAYEKSEPTYHPSLKKNVRMRQLRLEALQVWCDNTQVHEWPDVTDGVAKFTIETRAYEKKTTN